MYKYSKSLFIFRRDLRLHDNTGLLEALKNSKQVICIFIFDPLQIGTKNSYKSEKCIKFMLESLQDLEKDLQKNNSFLYLFYGNYENILEKILKSEKINSIFLNRDYTPFAINRDKKIEKFCHKYNIDFNLFGDILLDEPETALKLNKTPYTVFTPYYKNATKLKIKKPETNKHKNYITCFNNLNSTKVKNNNKKIYFKISELNPEAKINNTSGIVGGRTEALKILKNIHNFKNYEKIHNIPNFSTTKLSSHNKFGTVSIREVYWSIKENFGNNHSLLQQLYWRDFFTQIAFYYPKIFGHNFNEKYNKIKWSYNKKLFKLWCNGATGFPIVDAGMRELNQTGFMHNRVRMITASFLVKDLHIDWRWGEKYFAQKLIDYDPAVNNGNWQWCASTGCDAQPYFRIFNPWLQQKKFDPDCTYIKTWIKELKNIPNKDIFNWHKNYIKYKVYYGPILNHEREAKISKIIFSKSLL